MSTLFLTTDVRSVNLSNGALEIARDAAVRAHGLDPAIGHLHEDRTRTPSLPLDLMEPFRPACDRFAVKLASLGVLRTADLFESRDDGGVHLNSDGRRAFFPSWEEEMARSFPGADGQITTLRREDRYAKIGSDRFPIL